MKAHIHIQNIVGFDEKRALTLGMSHYAKSIVAGLLERGKFDYELGFFDLNGENGNRNRAEEIFGGYNAVFKECAAIKAPSANFGLDADDAYRNKSYDEYMKSDADVFWFPSHSKHFPSNIKRRAVTTVHDLLAISHPGMFSDVRRKSLELSTARVVQSKAEIITISEFSKSEIIKYTAVPNEKIHTVYEFIDKENCYPDFDGGFSYGDFSAEEDYILVMGRQEPQKNTLRIIQAFDSAAGKFPSAKLVFAGGYFISLPDYKNEVESLISNIKHRERIIFTGVVSNDERRILMSKAKCLCFPSIAEGFGLPILEAMNCGCPVITSNTTACPEVAGGAAILVNPSEVSEIAEAMAQVLTSRQLRHSLRRKGFERAKFFSAEKTLEQIENVLELAAGGANA